MEELESEEVKGFVDAQAAVAEAVLSTCDDHRVRLRGQLTALFDHPRYRAPFKRAGSYFYLHNPGLQPHSALYVQVNQSPPRESRGHPAESERDASFLQSEPSLLLLLLLQHGLGGGEEPDVLLDPNTFSDDATVSLAMFGVSHEGEHLAYGTSASGSDWVTIRVMRVRDRRHLHDEICWVSYPLPPCVAHGRSFQRSLI